MRSLGRIKEEVGSMQNTHFLLFWPLGSLAVSFIVWFTDFEGGGNWRKMR